MSAKRILNGLLDLDREVQCKLEQISQMQRTERRLLEELSMERCRSCTGELDRWQEELAEDVRRMVRRKRKAAERIEGIGDPEMRSLLRLRYLCGYTWERVAETLRYSTAHIYRLHDKALRELDKVEIE